MISITQGSTTAQAPQELIAPSSVKFRLADDERLYGTKRNTLHVFLMSQERAASLQPQKTDQVEGPQS